MSTSLKAKMKKLWGIYATERVLKTGATVIIAQIWIVMLKECAAKMFLNAQRGWMKQSIVMA